MLNSTPVSSKSPANNDVLIYVSSSGGWVAGTLATAGEANTIVNLGTGFPIFREKSGTNLNIRSLSAGDNVNIASSTSIITISAKEEHHFSFTIGASNTWNNENRPIWQAPRGTSATIAEILATASGGGDLNFNLQKRDWNGLTTAGADIFGTSQLATSAGEQYTSFDTDTIDPRGYLMFTTGSGAESGSVNYVQLSVYYTKA
jgi:hypothetical protein